MGSIIIIEDEPGIADTMQYALEQDGFSTSWFATGNEGEAAIRNAAPDLVILDVGLPDCNGFELFRSIRTFSDVPVIFLTARSDEIDRVAGLEMGADDYVTKPFSPREVTARVRAVLRRTVQTPELETKDLFSIDSNRFSITYAGTELDLSRYEYRILELMIKHPERVYSRAEIMDLVWEEPEFSGDRTVDTHIKKLRRKLKDVTPDFDPFITRRGMGYALRIEE